MLYVLYYFRLVMVLYVILGDFLARAFSTSQNKKDFLKFFFFINTVSGFAPGHKLMKITVKIVHLGKMKVRVNPILCF